MTVDPDGESELLALLAEVAQRGGPAQRQRANELLATLGQSPDAGTLEEALLLVDAFRNDPYLWR